MHPDAEEASEAPAPLDARSPRRWRRRLAIALGCGLAALAFLVFVLPPLTTTRRPAEPLTPQPLAAETAQRFAYAEAGTPAEPKARFNQARGWGYTSEWLKLEVTTPGEDAPHDVQVISYRSAEPGRRPAVLLTPIHRGRRPVTSFLAPLLARSGIHAVIVLRGETYFDPDAPLERLERVLWTALVDRRRVLDWLAAREDVDPQRLGAAGFSLGGLITTALLALEPERLRAGVIGLAGSPLGEVITRSDEAKLREFVAAHGAEGQGDLASALQAKTFTDFAAMARARRAPVLQIVATRDTTVPSATQEQLWEELGRPERIDLPTGHVSSALYAPWLGRQCVAWLVEALK